MPRLPPYALRNLTLHALHANCYRSRIPFTRNPLAEDARVHCVVLKIRTEPYGVNLHPKIHACRPYEVSAQVKRLLPQDPTACSFSQAFSALVPRTHRGEKRTNRAFAR